jgi:hypothetical protein
LRSEAGVLISAYLKTADKGVGDVILEEVSSLVVYARPTPHVLVVVLRFTLVKYGCTDGPHDDAEDKEPYSEDGVVSSDLFGSFVASFPVGDDDDDGHDQRDDSDGKQEDLRPDLGVLGPWWKAVSWCEGFGCVEDCECGCDHGKNDERAGEVDAS